MAADAAWQLWAFCAALAFYHATEFALARCLQTGGGWSCECAVFGRTACMQMHARVPCMCTRTSTCRCMHAYRAIERERADYMCTCACACRCVHAYCAFAHARVRACACTPTVHLHACLRAANTGRCPLPARSAAHHQALLAGDVAGAAGVEPGGPVHAAAEAGHGGGLGWAGQRAVAGAQWDTANARKGHRKRAQGVLMPRSP